MGILNTMFGQKKGVVNLDSQSFQDQYSKDENAVLIDVRTAGENSEARIPNSQLIDIMSPTFQKNIETLDKSKSYYVYCRSGNRSYHAGLMMAQMGFEKVYNLAGGIIDWHGEIESDY